MTTLTSTDLYLAVLAYFAGVLLAMIPIHFIVDLTWKLVEVEAITDESYNALPIHDILRRYIWQGDLVGAVERLLYVTAILLGRPEFIAIWLTLKTVARSPRWTQRKGSRAAASSTTFSSGTGYLSCSHSSASRSHFSWLVPLGNETVQRQSYS